MTRPLPSHLARPLAAAAALLLAGCAAPRLAASPTPAPDRLASADRGWRLHVSAATGDDRRDGLTPATAVRTIERAIELAGWAPADVLVAAGRYRAPSGMGWIVPDRTNLLGGWRADFADRRWLDEAARLDPTYATVLQATGDTSAAYLFGRTVLEGFTVSAEGAAHAALAVDGAAVIRHNTIRHSRLGIWAPASDARAEQGGLLIEANRLVGLPRSPGRPIQAEFRGAGGAVVARNNTVVTGADSLPAVAGP